MDNNEVELVVLRPTGEIVADEEEKEGDRNDD